MTEETTEGTTLRAAQPMTGIEGLLTKEIEGQLMTEIDDRMMREIEEQLKKDLLTTNGTIGQTEKEAMFHNRKLSRKVKIEVGHQETPIATPEKIKDIKMTVMEEKEHKPRAWHR